MQHVVDCLVAVRGDADRLAGLDERQDQVRGGVGLAGAGWSLDHKPGAIERMDGALRRLEQPRRVLPVGLGHDRRPGGAARQPWWIAAQKRVDVREGAAVSRHVARDRPHGIAKHIGVRWPAGDEGYLSWQLALPLCRA